MGVMHNCAKANDDGSNHYDGKYGHARYSGLLAWRNMLMWRPELVTINIATRVTYVKVRQEGSQLGLLAPGGH
jgi:hypothetical protein